MASPEAGITEGPSGFGDEFETITPGRKGKFQDAIRVVVADQAVRSGIAQQGVTSAAGTRDNFGNAILRIRIAIGILRAEAFVGMFVSSDYEIGMCRV